MPPLRSVKTDSILIIRMLVSAAVGAGADRDELMEAIGLTVADLDDSTHRVSSELQARVMDAGVRLSGDDALGIHVGEWLQPPALSVVGYIFFSATTLADALERTSHYHRLLSELGYPQLKVDGDTARLTLITRRTEPFPWPRQLAEWALSAFFCLMRRFAGDPLRLRCVRFQHPRPERISEHQRVFAGPLEFSQPENELVFGAEMLQLPNLAGHADPTLIKMLEAHAAELLQQLPFTDDWVTRVRTAVARRFNGGAAALNDVAQALGCSARSLQRQLSARGTSFRELRTDVQRELARVHLRNPDLSIDEIAFLLGFSDRATFHRAFRSWYGSTPAQYRNAGPED